MTPYKLEPNYGRFGEILDYPAGAVKYRVILSLEVPNYCL